MKGAQRRLETTECRSVDPGIRPRLATPHGVQITADGGRDLVRAVCLRSTTSPHRPPRTPSLATFSALAEPKASRGCAIKEEASAPNYQGDLSLKMSPLATLFLLAFVFQGIFFCFPTFTFNC